MCVCVFMPISIFKGHISGKECDFTKLKEEKKEKKKKKKEKKKKMNIKRAPLQSKVCRPEWNYYLKGLYPFCP